MAPKLQTLFVDVANRASHFMQMVVSKSLALDEMPRNGGSARVGPIKGIGRRWSKCHQPTRGGYFLRADRPWVPTRAEAAGAESLLLFHDFTPFRFVLGVQFIGLRSTGSRGRKRKAAAGAAGRRTWRMAMRSLRTRTER